MVATTRRNPPAALAPEAEAFLADLTRAAYEVALRHGIAGSFADLELAMWKELREVVREQVVCTMPGDRTSTSGSAA